MKKESAVRKEPQGGRGYDKPSVLSTEPQQELFGRFTSNVFLKGVAEIVSRLIYLLFFLYLARKLGDESFGLFSFAFSFAGIFVILVDPGLNLLLTKEIASDREKGPRLINLIYRIKILLSLVSLFLSVGTAFVVGYGRDTVAIVGVMSVALIFNALMEFHVAVFNGFEEMKNDAVLRIINKMLVSGFGILAISQGADLFEVVFVMAVAMFCSVILGFSMLRKRLFASPIRLNLRASRTLLSTALPIGLTMIFNALYLKLDMVLMSNLDVPASEIGWYAASVRIVEILMFIPAFVVAGSFPVFAHLAVSSGESFVQAVVKLAQVLIALAVPIVVIMTFGASDIVRLLYGPAYLHSIQALQILGWSLLFIFWNFHFSNVFVALNRQKVNAILSGTGVLCNVIANVYLISLYGYMGACLATLLTHVILWVLNTFFMRHIVPFGTLIRIVFKPALGGVLMALTILALPADSFYVAAALSSLVYVVTLVMLKTFSREDVSIARVFFTNKIKGAAQVLPLSGRKQ